MPALPRPGAGLDDQRVVGVAMAEAVFIGSKALGLTVLEAMANTLGNSALAGVIAYDDRADPRSRIDEIEQLAVRLEAPLVVCRSGDDVLGALRQWEPEVAIVSGWYRRIPVEAIPATRFYGFHA